MSVTKSPVYDSHGNQIFGRNHDGNVTDLVGATVPTDAEAGYSTGCIFRKTGGGSGTAVYINEGTASSCDFNAGGVIGSPTAAQTTLADSGGFTAQTTVEGALAEIYQHLESTKVVLPIPLGGAILAAGTPMAAFADNAASNPGVTLADSKAVGLRWNDAATQTAVWLPSIVVPEDLDATADAVLHILASKTGATLADAVTFTVTAFNQAVAAAHDADSDFGGTSSAMTGDATAKTVQHLTLTLATANLAAAPASISMSIKPTNGTLGTDDVIVESMWIEFKRKLLTS